MEKLNSRLKRITDFGLFHESIGDIRLLMNINELYAKLNELIEENELIKEEIAEVKKMLNKG
jgi:regulator of replication initiation timing